MSRRYRWGSPAAALLVLLLAGCGPDMSDLQKYVEEVKSRKTTQIEPIPQMKQYEAYAYVEGGRRDPYQPTVANNSAPGTAQDPGKGRNKEPLEEFPLDSLRLVGRVNYKGRVYAMVKAPDSVIHRVTIGDHMGQNYGKITAISETEVQLAETIPDGFGGFIERPATLATAQ